MWGKNTTRPEDPLKGIPFSTREGMHGERPLTLFALSTCGFCRRAIAFLDERGLAYRFVYVDKLGKSMQDDIRTYVKCTFRTLVSYPFLCIGEEDYLTGFIKASWEKELCDE